MPKPSTPTIVIGVVYCGLMCVLVTVFLVARHRVLTTDGASSQAAWQSWRAAAQRQQDGAGPVIRRAPKSDEPPSLVLLRDHYVASLASLLVLSTALYFALAIMVRGVCFGPGFEPDLAPDDERETLAS